MAKVAQGEAAAFRAYYTEVPEDVREEIYEEILACEINGDPDAFERLTVRVLAYAASGRMLPSQVDACRELLSLISHSIVSRKAAVAEVSVTKTVTARLNAAAKLEDAVRKKLPNYGNLDEFVNSQGAVGEPLVLEAVEVDDPPNAVRLTRG